MGRLNRHKIKAATLFETIVALVIVSMIFGIATTIFVRVSAGSVSIKKLRAAGILKDYSEKVRRNRLFFDDDEKADSFEIKRIVTAEDNFTKLWRIHYYIFDNKKTLLSEWQQYVFSDQ